MRSFRQGPRCSIDSNDSGRASLDAVRTERADTFAVKQRTGIRLYLNRNNNQVESPLLGAPQPSLASSTTSLHELPGDDNFIFIEGRNFGADASDATDTAANCVLSPGFKASQVTIAAVQSCDTGGCSSRTCMEELLLKIKEKLDRVEDILIPIRHEVRLVTGLVAKGCPHCNCSSNTLKIGRDTTASGQHPQQQSHREQHYPLQDDPPQAVRALPAKEQGVAGPPVCAVAAAVIPKPGSSTRAVYSEDNMISALTPALDPPPPQPECQPG